VKTVSLDKEQFLEKIKSLSDCTDLPSKKDLSSLCSSVCAILDSEDNSFRPVIPGTDGLPGGLLDFTEKPALPLVIVPDIHARARFVYNILTYTPPLDFVSQPGIGQAPGSGQPTDADCENAAGEGVGQPENAGQLTGFGQPTDAVQPTSARKPTAAPTILDLLEQKAIRLLFVGDYLHAESRARERWFSALDDFENNNFTGEAITQEMTEGLSTVMILQSLKIRFPMNVHLLKGNHENIKNECGSGNFPFKKFANEGEMVRFFITEKYNEEVLNGIASFENLLPVAAAFPKCLVTHAEPRRFFSKDELIESPCSEEVVYGLTWTPNDEAKKGSVKRMLEEFFKDNEAVYIGGHRSVEGNFNLRQDGKFIQIHNPKKQNISLIYTDRIFNPNTDIYDVEK
jgi:hypothetical protein